jgi:hypothetical protein
MKRRSAMLVAAGLVLALAVAGLGFTMGLTGPTADAKRAPVEKAQREPKVRTITRTITVHKKAKPTQTQGAGTIVVQAAPTTSTSFADSSSVESASEDGYEHESDDSYEHESDDSSHAGDGSYEAGDD